MPPTLPIGMYVTGAELAIRRFSPVNYHVVTDQFHTSGIAQRIFDAVKAGDKTLPPDRKLELTKFVMPIMKGFREPNRTVQVLTAFDTGVGGLDAPSTMSGYHWTGVHIDINKGSFSTQSMNAERDENEGEGQLEPSHLEVIREIYANNVPTVLPQPALL